MRDEGLTPLLLSVLNPTLPTQFRPELHRDTNCSWGVWGTLCVLAERLKGISFSKSSLRIALSKPETNWESIKALERAQGDGEVFLLCSPSLSGEGPKIIRKIHRFSSVCGF